MTISVGPGVEIDRAVARRRAPWPRRRSGCPGPTILSTRGIVAVPYASAAIACAPPTRNSRVTPASSAAAITAGSGRGQHDDDLAHAGDARRHRGHQQRRGQRKAAAGHVAADARERLDALLDRHAGRDLEIPVTRNLPERDAGDVARGLRDGAPDVRRDARRAARASRPATLRAAAARPSNCRAKRISARSPPARTRSTIARTRRSSARSSRAPAPAAGRSLACRSR